MICRILLILGFISIGLELTGQSAPFNIALEPISISELGGLQSYSFGQDNGKWLLVGGRLDGLHRRQPWASFDIDGHNNLLIVVDPVSLQKWSAPLTSLPITIQDQLSSTNMNFYQKDEYLYVIGGYGYSTFEDRYVTYPYLTAIKVSDVIDAIINGSDFTSFFRQIQDSQFQVTGGRLRMINEVYHLLGGQKFTGRYNPHNNPSFIQEYTNQIRRFTLSDDGTNLNINHLPSFSDENNLHRRDYNAESQILPDGSEGITMFSGVFQSTIDLPYLNTVTVDFNNYAVNDSFLQYYNHYHCAAIPLYSSSQNEMHTVFFGGIAQFYDSSGILMQDNNVPFVKTIARVTRSEDGKMAEYKLPIEMPTLLGAGSEFIPNKNIPLYNNDVFQLDKLTSDSTLLGYIFGGIQSSNANIFWINNGTQSVANDKIYKVFLTENSISTHVFNEQSTGTLDLMIYPNPNVGNFTIDYYIKQRTDIKLSLFDMNGQLLLTDNIRNQSEGSHKYVFDSKNYSYGEVYLISVETPYEKAIRKIVNE